MSDQGTDHRASADFAPTLDEHAAGESAAR